MKNFGRTLCEENFKLCEKKNLSCARKKKIKFTVVKEKSSKLQKGKKNLKVVKEKNEFRKKKFSVKYCVRKRIIKVFQVKHNNGKDQRYPMKKKFKKSEL